MLNAASNLVAGMSGPLFVICLLLIFFVLGFVVPSSSGLAVLAMPIFAPLADTVGIPRWIIVAAYQFGQYAMLYIAPTGLVMATLQMLDMKMSHWFKFVWPMMVFTPLGVRRHPAEHLLGGVRGVVTSASLPRQSPSLPEPLSAGGAFFCRQGATDDNEKRFGN